MPTLRRTLSAAGCIPLDHNPFSVLSQPDTPNLTEFVDGVGLALSQKRFKKAKPSVASTEASAKADAEKPLLILSQGRKSVYKVGGDENICERSEPNFF